MELHSFRLFGTVETYEVANPGHTVNVVEVLPSRPLIRKAVGGRRFQARDLRKAAGVDGGDG